jgi:hypothetical protein
MSYPHWRLKRAAKACRAAQKTGSAPSKPGVTVFGGSGQQLGGWGQVPRPASAPLPSPSRSPQAEETMLAQLLGTGLEDEARARAAVLRAPGDLSRALEYALDDNPHTMPVPVIPQRVSPSRPPPGPAGSSGSGGALPVANAVQAREAVEAYIYIHICRAGPGSRGGPPSWARLGSGASCSHCRPPLGFVLAPTPPLHPSGGWCSGAGRERTPKESRGRETQGTAGPGGVGARAGSRALDSGGAAAIAAGRGGRSSPGPGPPAESPWQHSEKPHRRSQGPHLAAYIGEGEAPPGSLYRGGGGPTWQPI